MQKFQFIHNTGKNIQLQQQQHSYFCARQNHRRNPKRIEKPSNKVLQNIYKTATSVTTISKITNARLKENADNYYSTPILIRKPFPHSRRRKNSVDTREKKVNFSHQQPTSISTSNTSQSYKDNISREATKKNGKSIKYNRI